MPRAWVVLVPLAITLTTGACATKVYVPPTGSGVPFAEAWAMAAGGRVRLALVAPPEHIDPGKFGVTVAANRGMVRDVFVAEAEAIAWLDSLK